MIFELLGSRSFTAKMTLEGISPAEEPFGADEEPTAAEREGGRGRRREISDDALIRVPLSPDI